MSIHEVFAFLRVARAADAIAYYETVFGATEKFRLTEPSGRIGHAELLLGGTSIMLSDEFPEFGLEAPAADRRPASDLHLHVDDADKMIEHAVAAGATLLRAPTDQFYGERTGRIRDPFGQEWTLGHSIEEVTPAEMQRRYDAMFK